MSNSKLDEITNVITEVVPQPVADLFHTPITCAGAASSYVLRKIAYRAGIHVPAGQSTVFDELNYVAHGATLVRVQHWFDRRSAALYLMGYRLRCQFVTAPTRDVVSWVKHGRGYRGAMLPTMFSGQQSTSHAVGIVIDRVDDTSTDDLVMIDPSPGTGGTSERGPIPSTLGDAHRERNHQALMFAWTGWS
ncbi:MAG TPA: hypothetical protein VGM90_04200 [Kofleriaceae bacterium]|jgi:hypothetical protein